MVRRVKVFQAQYHYRPEGRKHVQIANLKTGLAAFAPTKMSGLVGTRQ